MVFMEFGELFLGVFRASSVPPVVEPMLTRTFGGFEGNCENREDYNTKKL